MTERPQHLAPDVRQVRIVPGGADINLVVPSNLLYLDGHFPELGVLPGVVQMHWAAQLARQHLGARVSGRTLQVKFRNTIGPGASLTLTLREDAARARVSFEYREGAAIASSGQLAMEPP